MIRTLLDTTADDSGARRAAWTCFKDLQERANSIFAMISAFIVTLRINNIIYSYGIIIEEVPLDLEMPPIN